MKKITACLFVFLMVSGSFLFAAALSRGDDGGNTNRSQLPKQIGQIFKVNCASCHSGLTPPQELILEPGQLVENTVNVPSMQKMDLKLIDTADPPKSYLLMKLKGKKNIVGKQMPLKRDPLPEKEIKKIEQWIWNLKETGSEKSAAYPGSTSAPRRNPFWGITLVNLPTTTVVGKGDVLFRFSHRFVFSAKEGYDVFYGFDGPAVVFFSLSLGMARNLHITLGRSNLFQEFELAFKWRILAPSKSSSFPLSMALRGGGNWVSQSGAVPGDKLKFNLQVSFAYPLSSRISLLLAPGYSSKVNHFDPSPEGTFVLGAGARIKLGRSLSLMGEWLPVLSGYKANTNGWGLGFEYKVGKHLFQVFALNSLGITCDQFLPGGDLMLSDGDFRFGFNIYREF